MNPRTLLDSASFINYVSRYQSDVCKYNSIHTARAWPQPGLPILHLLGIFQQQELKNMDSNNILSFACYPLKSIFDELSGMDTHDIEEMSSKDALVIADNFKQPWITGSPRNEGSPIQSVI